MKYKFLIFTFFICSGFCFPEFSGNSGFISSEDNHSYVNFASGQHSTNQITSFIFKTDTNQNSELNIRKSKSKTRNQGLTPCFIRNEYCSFPFKLKNNFAARLYHASTQTYKLLRAPPSLI
jgi:hypothetical protein